MAEEIQGSPVTYDICCSITSHRCHLQSERELHMFLSRGSSHTYYLKPEPGLTNSNLTLPPITLTPTQGSSGRSLQEELGSCLSMWREGCSAVTLGTGPAPTAHHVLCKYRDSEDGCASVWQTFPGVPAFMELLHKAQEHALNSGSR